MNEQQRQFLTLPDPPARFSVEQTAWKFNFQEHDIPVLVAAKLLKPLGNPPVNGVKFFAATEVLELSRDRAWLSRATNAIHQHWQTKNEWKKKAVGSGS